MPGKQGVEGVCSAGEDEGHFVLMLLARMMREEVERTSSLLVLHR